MSEATFKSKDESSLDSQKVVDLATVRIKVTNKTGHSLTVKPTFITAGAVLTDVEIIITSSSLADPPVDLSPVEKFLTGWEKL